MSYHLMSKTVVSWHISLNIHGQICPPILGGWPGHPPILGGSSARGPNVPNKGVGGCSWPGRSRFGHWFGDCTLLGGVGGRERTGSCKSLKLPKITYFSTYVRGRSLQRARRISPSLGANGQRRDSQRPASSCGIDAASLGVGAAREPFPPAAIVCDVCRQGRPA